MVFTRKRASGFFRQSFRTAYMDNIGNRIETYHPPSALIIPRFHTVLKSTNRFPRSGGAAAARLPAP